MKPRGLFQIHFSTAIALTFVASVMLWLNASRKSFGFLGWPIQSSSATEIVSLNLPICAFILLAIAITIELRISRPPQPTRKRTLIAEMIVGWVFISENHMAQRYYFLEPKLAILTLITHILSAVFALFICHFISEISFDITTRKMSDESA